MASTVQTRLPPRDAIKTYRYLRIGMIGAVVLLGASIAIEYDDVDCLQTSISAYYYTPVRAIFVGGMMAVGLALIVIKGRGTLEDICLNFAGMLAPVVAVAPTTDVGDCWSVQPEPLPVKEDGTLAGWVVANIDNNFSALLLAGAAGLVVAGLTAIVVNKGPRAAGERVGKGTLLSLAATGLALLLGWWLIENWDDFYTRAHGYAAVGMFLFLIGAVVGKAIEHRHGSNTQYFPIYASIGVLMVLGGIAIPIFRIGEDHTVFVLEAFEIVLFALFWGVQTREHWDEEPPTAPVAVVER